MSWYPLFVQMDGRRCLVVGGGAVARRRAEGLLDAGASVVAVSPDFSAAFDDLAWRHRGRLLLERQPYASRDLARFVLVVAATDSETVNARVADDAHRAGVWVNVVDTPDLCSVQAAAVVRRGPLQIAIHTGGAYPALSSALREELEHYFDPWFETYLGALGRARDWLRDTAVEATRRRAILRALADPALRHQCRGLAEDELFERLAAEATRRLADVADEP